MTMKQAGERGRFGEKVILAREIVRDAFRRLMDGPGIGFGPELAFAGAGGRNVRTSEFSGYHRKAPENALLELSDTGGEQMEINHRELRSTNPYGRAFTALALVGRHDAWDPGPPHYRESSLRDALKAETDPRAATVILFAYAALAEEMGMGFKSRILADIERLNSGVMIAGFRRNRKDWREEYGDFTAAVGIFFDTIVKLRATNDLGQDLKILYGEVSQIMKGMHEAQKQIGCREMPLPPMAYNSFFMGGAMERGGVLGCDPVAGSIPDLTEHGNLLDLKSEWGYIRAKAAVRAMEILKQALDALIRTARQEDRRGPLSTIKAKGDFDAKVDDYKEAANSILEALQKEKNPLAAEIMLRAYVYLVYRQVKPEKMLETLDSLNLDFGPREDQFAGTLAAIDNYSKVLDGIRGTLEEHGADRLIRGFRPGLLNEAREALSALKIQHEADLQAMHELSQEPCSGV